MLGLAYLAVVLAFLAVNMWGLGFLELVEVLELVLELVLEFQALVELVLQVMELVALAELVLEVLELVVSVSVVSVLEVSVLVDPHIDFQQKSLVEGTICHMVADQVARNYLNCLEPRVNRLDIRQLGLEDTTYLLQAHNSLGIFQWCLQGSSCSRSLAIHRSCAMGILECICNLVDTRLPNLLDT